MGKQFDELAKAFAGGVSRRTALRRFLAGTAGAALASLLPGRANAQVPAPDLRQQCIESTTITFQLLGLPPSGPEFDRQVAECLAVAVPNQTPASTHR